MPEIVPQTLKKLRIERKLSQAQLAHRTERFTSRPIAARTLARIERSNEERYSCNQKTIDLLAKALDVDRSVLSTEIAMSDETPAPIVQSIEPIEHFETRLVKLDDKFVIVEFSNDHETGRIIARGIEDEEAGKRLSEAADLRKKLIEVFRMMSDPDGFDSGFFSYLVNVPVSVWEQHDYNDEDEIKRQLENYLEDLAQMLGVDARPVGKLTLSLVDEQ